MIFLLSKVIFIENGSNENDFISLGTKQFLLSKCILRISKKERKTHLVFKFKGKVRE